jgi:hypothetical protein
MIAPHNQSLPGDAFSPSSHTNRSPRAKVAKVKPKKFDPRIAVYNKNRVTKADMIKSDLEVETIVSPVESPALKVRNRLPTL